MSNLLTISPSPHAKGKDTVKSLMGGVLLALAPAFLCSLYFFGLGALITTLVSVISCVLFEWLITKFILKQTPKIADLSAVLTGVLLAFNLPSNISPFIVMFVVPLRFVWPLPLMAMSAAVIVTPALTVSDATESVLFGQSVMPQPSLSLLVIVPVPEIVRLPQPVAGVVVEAPVTVPCSPIRIAVLGPEEAVVILCPFKFKVEVPPTKPSDASRAVMSPASSYVPAVKM